ICLIICCEFIEVVLSRKRIMIYHLYSRKENGLLLKFLIVKIRHADSQFHGLSHKDFLELIGIGDPFQAHGFDKRLYG
ncbi:hypothetical protein P4T04_19980, partial [Bacillus badius]|uniref:hypothetical protein n=1 Tax=Bacillus badius TaxID=1455 RepID=UPI002E1D32B1|nr:hypothetical protein [Bacillus badius]